MCNSYIGVVFPVIWSVMPVVCCIPLQSDVIKNKYFVLERIIINATSRPAVNHVHTGCGGVSNFNARNKTVVSDILYRQ